MKRALKTTVLALACALLLSPTHGFANNCPEKTSELKSATITIKKVYEEHNAAFMQFENNGTKSLQISYGDMDIYKKHQGKSVKITYKDVQYFDEHDGECVQRQEIQSVGNTKLSSN